PLCGTLREALRVSPAETLRERSRLCRETLLQRCLTAPRLRFFVHDLSRIAVFQNSYFVRERFGKMR
ncbi:hypothetical protein, partial [Brasilonema bromeliae]|uniref:hypothetical protein n=1 Tax=Brasilonema bromeliae TaxID=383615 RepID=UPI001B7D10E5